MQSESECVECEVDVKVKVKVKCNFLHELRLSTGRTAHWESRCVALLFHDQRH